MSYLRRSPLKVVFLRVFYLIGGCLQDQVLFSHDTVDWRAAVAPKDSCPEMWLPLKTVAPKDGYPKRQLLQKAELDLERQLSQRWLPRKAVAPKAGCPESWLPRKPVAP